MQPQRTPKWMTALIVLCMLPVVAFPSLLDICSEDSPLKMFVWFYPLYVFAAGVCAWMCYPARKELCWILLVILLLTHAAIWATILI